MIFLLKILFSIWHIGNAMEWHNLSATSAPGLNQIATSIENATKERKAAERMREPSGIYSYQPPMYEFIQDPPGPVSMYPSQHMDSSSSYAMNQFVQNRPESSHMYPSHPSMHEFKHHNPQSSAEEVRKAAVAERNRLRQKSRFGFLADDTIFQLKYLPSDEEVNQFGRTYWRLATLLSDSDSDIKILIVFGKFAEKCQTKPGTTSQKTKLFQNVYEDMKDLMNDEKLKNAFNGRFPQSEIAKLLSIAESEVSRYINDKKKKKSTHHNSNVKEGRRS